VSIERRIATVAKTPTITSGPVPENRIFTPDSDVDVGDGRLAR
jgi:hypothetical protein